MATVIYPNVIYGLSSSNSYEVRSFKSQFGDGYQEVTPDGINYITRSGTLNHPLITVAEAKTVRDFLKQYCGTSQVVEIKDCFEDPTGNTLLKVYLNNWVESFEGGGTLVNINVSFREAFNE